MTVKYKRFIWTALVMVMAVAVTACSNKTEFDETSKKVSEEKQTGIELPYELDDGRLVLNSIFQSSISNPDCNDENGENMASIEVINQSGKFLASADVGVTLEGGTTLNFKIEDLVLKFSFVVELYISIIADAADSFAEYSMSDSPA